MGSLTEKQFMATFNAPMKRLSDEASPPFDFWEYLDSIPDDDFEGHDASLGRVTYVWEDASKHYQHVLISTERENVFLVLVLDLVGLQVYGHRLLNLGHEYGLETT
jgi:hypothetical protein